LQRSTAFPPNGDEVEDHVRAIFPLVIASWSLPSKATADYTAGLKKNVHIGHGTMSLKKKTSILACSRM
jgi:hypothetical protein